MDYNLVLKFKKYPENKPESDKFYTIIYERSDKAYVFSGMEGCDEDSVEWTTPLGYNIIAFCEYPSSNKLIELLNSTQETILVTKRRLNYLELSDNILSALQEAGVDNWCGYDDAMDILNRQEDED